MTNGLVDASDLYRAALVQGIAAIDAYFHGVVLDKAVDLLMGGASTSLSPSKVGLPFVAVHEILSAATPADRELITRRRIANRLALETFQQPDDIAKALATVGTTRIWSRAFSDAEQAKTALKVIVARRNNIVHSCDVDPLTPGSLTPLTAADAIEAIQTVESTVTVIDALC